MDMIASLQRVGPPGTRPTASFPSGICPELRELVETWGEGSIGGWLRLLAPGSAAFTQAQAQLRTNATAWRLRCWAYAGIPRRVWEELSVTGVDPVGGALVTHTTGRMFYLAPGGVELLVGTGFDALCEKLLFAADVLVKVLLRPEPGGAQWDAPRTYVTHDAAADATRLAGWTTALARGDEQTGDALLTRIAWSAIQNGEDF